MSEHKTAIVGRKIFYRALFASPSLASANFAAPSFTTSSFDAPSFAAPSFAPPSFAASSCTTLGHFFPSHRRFASETEPADESRTQTYSRPYRRVGDVAVGITHVIKATKFKRNTHNTVCRCVLASLCKRVCCQA